MFASPARTNLRPCLGSLGSLRTLWTLTLLAGLVASADPASGHGKSVSYSSWQLAGNSATVDLRISLLELTRLQIPSVSLPQGTQPANGGVGRYLATHLELASSAGPCTPGAPPRSRPGEEGWVSYHWSLDCPAGDGHSITSRVLLIEAPSHLHFARVTIPARTPAHGESSRSSDPADATSGGEPSSDESARARSQRRVFEKVLSSAEPTWIISDLANEGAHAGGEPTGSTLRDYIELGIRHILSGWDHLAFVFALVLLAGSLREVAKLVTGFTLAHSITLALAVLGLVHPRAAPVEAVIGFSVALVAAENSWILSGRNRWIPITAAAGLGSLVVLAVLRIGQLEPLTLIGLALFSLCHFALLARSARPSLQRIALAFAFGLVHGFGFAGVLGEMSLPTHRLAPALLGFNLGVEIGQLAVVVMIWPMLRAIEQLREGRPYRVLAELASAAVCGLGLHWFLLRAFGPGA